MHNASERAMKSEVCMIKSIIITIVPSYTGKKYCLLSLTLLLMLHTRNNTDGNKLLILYGIALHYGDGYRSVLDGFRQLIVTKVRTCNCCVTNCFLALCKYQKEKRRSSSVWYRIIRYWYTMQILSIVVNHLLQVLPTSDIMQSPTAQDAWSCNFTGHCIDPPEGLPKISVDFGSN